jgi:hypothetical protein
VLFCLISFPFRLPFPVLFSVCFFPVYLSVYVVTRCNLDGSWLVYKIMRFVIYV